MSRALVQVEVATGGRAGIRVQAGDHLIAAAAPGQHLHLETVLHGHEVRCEQPRRVGEREVSLRLTEDENAVVDGDLTLGQRTVQRRRLGVAKRSRPALEQQSDQFVVRAAGDAVVDAGPEAVARVGELFGDALALLTEPLDGPLIRLVGQRVQVAVVEHRGRGDAGLLRDVAQTHALQSAGEHGPLDGLTEFGPAGSLILLPRHCCRSVARPGYYTEI